MLTVFSWHYSYSDILDLVKWLRVCWCFYWCFVICHFIVLAFCLFLYPDYEFIMNINTLGTGVESEIGNDCLLCRALLFRRCRRCCQSGRRRWRGAKWPCFFTLVDMHPKILRNFRALYYYIFRLQILRHRYSDHRQGRSKKFILGGYIFYCTILHSYILAAWRHRLQLVHKIIFRDWLWEGIYTDIPPSLRPWSQTSALLATKRWLFIWFTGRDILLSNFNSSYYSVLDILISVWFQIKF